MAARLPREIRREATRSLINAGRPAGRLFASSEMRGNERLLREPMRLLPIINRLRTSAS